MLSLALSNCAMPLVSVLPGTMLGIQQGNSYHAMLSSTVQIMVYEDTGSTVGQHLLGLDGPDDQALPTAP